MVSSLRSSPEDLVWSQRLAKPEPNCLFASISLVEFGDGAEAHEFAESTEFVERHVAADARSLLLEMRVNLAQRFAGSEEAEGRENCERITELFERLLIDHRSAPTLDHVGHQRLVEGPADGAHFLNALGTFDEQDIRARL